jgi:hypothetical protein
MCLKLKFTQTCVSLKPKVESFTLHFILEPALPIVGSLLSIVILVSMIHWSWFKSDKL